MIIAKAFSNLNADKQFTNEQLNNLLPIKNWLINNFSIDPNDVKQLDKRGHWMNQFVKDGSKILSISISLAKNLLETDLPTDDVWNFETFGFAGLIEIGEHNYIFTDAIADDNEEFITKMIVFEYATNNQKLFSDTEVIDLLKRISYIFRNRPNGLIIQ